MAQSIRLSDGEWNLMNLLWERAPRTVTELVHALDTGWGKHTVMTMLSRLEAKGAVRREQGERAREYYPAVGRAGVAMEETESFLKKVYGGSLGLMMSAMVRERGLSDQELGELYEILNEAEEARHDS